MTFRVYNETADGFLDGTMEVEDVDAALELAAVLAGSECFSFRPSSREERKEFTAVALQVGRLIEPCRELEIQIKFVMLLTYVVLVSCHNTRLPCPRSCGRRRR